MELRKIINDARVFNKWQVIIDATAEKMIII